VIQISLLLIQQTTCMLCVQSRSHSLEALEPTFQFLDFIACDGKKIGVCNNSKTFSVKIYYQPS